MKDDSNNSSYEAMGLETFSNSAEQRILQLANRMSED